MAQEIEFHSEVGGAQFNVLPFRGTVKGTSSRIVTTLAKNVSETHRFEGLVYVTPAEGRSYSEDLFIAENLGRWEKHLEISLGPGESYPFKIRVVPNATPERTTGRAAITAAGDWELLPA